MPNPTDTELNDDQDDGAQAGDAGQGDDAGSGAEEGGDDLVGDGADDAGSQGGGSEDGDGADEEGDGQTVVSFGGDDTDDSEQADDRAPAWVRDVRKQNRAQAREIHELKRKLAAVQPTTTVVVGVEPTLESCNGDIEKFKVEYAAYVKRKTDADVAAESARQAQENQAQQWRTRLASIDAEEGRLRLVGADEARDAFMTQLTPFQQAAVLQAFEDTKTSAMLRYALGHNATELTRVAQIQDPVRFVVAITELRQKMQTRKKGAQPPAPERRVRTGTPGAGAGGPLDNQLERLRAEADKTGDRSKVAAYLRKKKVAAAA